MFHKKCPGCAERIEKSFNFCPFCGISIKEKKERENFGLLGREDAQDLFREDLRIPQGMEKMVHSLIKQLERQIQDPNFAKSESSPKGFHIKISAGKPNVVNQVMRPSKELKKKIEVSEKELDRRRNLPKVEAESKVKRLGDRIIYEITAPGITERGDIVVTRLAAGLEIRAYSKDACYIKSIPLNVEVLHYFVKDEKVILELKG